MNTSGGRRAAPVAAVPDWRLAPASANIALAAAKLASYQSASPGGGGSVTTRRMPAWMTMGAQ